MYGLLVAIIYSLLFQTGEVMPSLLGGSTLPNLPNSGPVLPSQNGQPYAPVKPEIGWKQDPIDGKICMIVQIHPSLIDKFAAGPGGQELPEDIPLELQGRVQRIIFRIGTSPPERMPLPANLGSNRINNGQAPFIAGLNNTAPIDNRTPVTIDTGHSSDVINTRSGSSLPGGLGGTLATVPGNPTNVLPPAGRFAQASDPTAVLPSTSGFSNDSTGFNRDRDVVPSNLNQPGRDGFTPTNPTRGGAFDLLRSNNGRPNSQNTTGNYANSNSPYANPANSTYLNSGNPYPNNNPSGYPTIATNPNPPTFGGPATYPTLPNTQGYSASPSLSQLNNNATYGQTGSPYANNGSPYLGGQYPNLAARLGTGSLPSNGGRYEDSLYDDPTLTSKENKLLPFLLLFSIVGNVYLGLWMSHLRTRYRQLLGNMRGVPLSDLDN